MSNETDLERRFSEEFQDLTFRPPMQITLLPLDLWILCSQVQLAVRHPTNIGPSAERAAAIARQMFDAIAPEGTALAEVAQLGWDSSNDLPPSPKDVS